MRTTVSMLTAAAMLSFVTTSALAHPTSSKDDAAHVTVGDLSIAHPWSRATPGSAKVGGGYLEIENKGTVADTLLGGTTEAASDVEVHEMAVTDGVMKMRHLAKGLTIEPGKSAILKPGGYHIMFMGLKRPLKEGEKLPVTLQFEKAGKVDVTFEVQGIGSKGPQAHDHGHDHNDKHDHGHSHK